MNNQRTVLQRTRPALIAAFLAIVLGMVLSRADRRANNKAEHTNRSPTVRVEPPQERAHPKKDALQPKEVAAAAIPPAAAQPAERPVAIPMPEPPVPVDQAKPPVAIAPAVEQPQAAPAAPVQANSGAPTLPSLPPGVTIRGEHIAATTTPHPATIRRPDLPPPPILQAAGAMQGGQGDRRINIQPNGGGFGAISTNPIADMVRAQAEANLANSVAATNIENARSLGLENRIRLTETFFENRRINRAARAIEAGPRPNMEQIVRWARISRPRRLTSLELDRVTGEIAWPYALTDPIFTEHRKALEERFHQRAESGYGFQFLEVEEVRNKVDEMIVILKDNMGRYTAGDYGSARTFLESLSQEAIMPVDD